jgi:isoleucyl-tRNA synthetase
MDCYELDRAVTPLVAMIEELTNWYIRRCRSRFWSNEDTPDRRAAFSTLYQVLITLSKVAAPFIPFLSEALFLNLRREVDPESVHLCDFPEVELKLHNLELEKEVEAAQTLVGLGHSLRKEQKIKVRQPLGRAHAICADRTYLAALKRQDKLIREELNVHTVEFLDREESFVQLICKPNFRVLGKKVGPKMRAIQAIIGTFSHEQLQILLDGGSLDINVEREAFTLTSEDVQVERKVREGLIARSEAGITLVLDTQLTEELLLEGIARELINKINAMRRDAGFYVTDRVEIIMETTNWVKKALNHHQKLVMQEVLGVSLKFEKNDGTEWEINGEKTIIALKAIGAKELF